MNDEKILQQNPTMHKPVDMGTRVIVEDPFIPTYQNPPKRGTVAGIASMGIVYSYIVILAEEINTWYGPCKAVSIPGTLLKGVNGESWRLEE